ncbi:MAG: ankyrin repeat domain-containing protein [Gammaproteobacteria bacterium]
MAVVLGLERYDIESGGKCGRTAFMCAAIKGQLAVLRLLKERGAAIHGLDEEGNNALHLASAVSGDVSTVSWLLALESCDIESRSGCGRTAFLLVAASGQLEVLQLLQESGANIYAVDTNGNNALHIALLYSANISTVEWLLGLQNFDIESRGQHGRTAFLLAAAKGQLEVLQLLEKRGADIHAEDKYGNNALHTASLFSGDKSTVAWLLTRDGFSIESRSAGRCGRTPFLCAAEWNQLEVLKFLQEKGANIHAVDDNGNNALHIALLNLANVSTVKWLLDLNRYDIDSRGEYGRTALMLAAQKGQLKALQLLQERGADIHAVDDQGNNALHIASLFSGDKSTVAWLLTRNGFSIESRSVGRHSRTPFLCAAEKGHLTVLKLLKENGANIHAVDDNGNNALHLTILCSGNVDVAQWLIQDTLLNKDSVGRHGRTAFLLAVRKGQLGVLKLLKDAGANTHAVDDQGNNALHYASSYTGENKEAMVNWLRAHYEQQRCSFLQAAKQGDLGTLKRLHELGVDIHGVDSNGNNALHLASLYSGDVPTVLWLLALEGCDIESRGQYGRTAFLCAARNSQPTVLRLLKEEGAAIHAVDDNGNNALHLASLYSGDVPTVLWLLALKGCDIESRGQYGRTAFLCTARNGQPTVLRLLKEEGAAIHTVDDNGNNALHLASLSSDVSKVSWLLEQEGFDIESRSGCGRTPFLCAARQGQLEVLKELKKQNAAIDVVDTIGNNALHIASLFSGDKSTVAWLLTRNGFGIESRSAGRYGRTPFLCAAEKGHLTVLKLLQENGANIHAVDDNGYNVLQLAILQSGSVEVVRWLVRETVLDKESVDRHKRTAFLFAARKGHLEILKVLSDAGANIHAVDDQGNNALYYASLYKGENKEAMVNWLRAQEAVEEQPDNHEENEQQRYAFRM